MVKDFDCQDPTCVFGLGEVPIVKALVKSRTLPSAGEKELQSLSLAVSS